MLLVRSLAEFDGLDGLSAVLPSTKTFDRIVSESDIQYMEDVEASVGAIRGFYPIRQILNYSSYSMLTIDPVWFTVSQVIQQDPRHPIIALCGSKNMGKSTFARFLVNRLLQSHSEVYFLETDIGQSELSPSGLVTLSRLTQPILSPPYCHLMARPVASYFVGHASADSDPVFHFNSIAAAFKTFTQSHSHSGAPLIINSSGWITGIGLDLLMQTLQLTRPAHIVQFADFSPTGELDTGSKRNLPNLFELGLTSKLKTLWTNDASKKVLGSGGDLSGWKPSIHLLRAIDAFLPSKPRKSPADNRTLNLIAHFCSRDMNSEDALRLKQRQRDYGTVGVEAGIKLWDFTPLTSRVPFKALYKDLEFSFMDGRVQSEDVLLAINATLVGLVIGDREDNQGKLRVVQKMDPLSHVGTLIGQCAGLGVVRACEPLDAPSSDTGLYLVTPVSADRLGNVNLLARGSINLPTCLVYQDEKIRDGPYADNTMMDDGTSVAESARKTRRNLQRRVDM